MNLQDKTIEELNEIIRIKSDSVNELQILMNKERNILRDVRLEIQRRDKWNVKDVTDRMFEQLVEYKDQISKLAFNKLSQGIKDVTLDTNNRYTYRNRHYKQGQILVNIYFDIQYLIKKKLSDMKLINERYSGSVFYIKFEFNRKDNEIIRSHNSNIFSKGKNKPFDFNVPVDELSGINREILKNVKKKYKDYEDIIPDMIKVVNFIDNEVDSIFLAHYLSNK